MRQVAPIFRGKFPLLTLFLLATSYAYQYPNPQSTHTSERSATARSKARPLPHHFRKNLSAQTATSTIQRAPQTTELPYFPTSVPTLEDYVNQHKGKQPIKRILVANNGMAAVKYMLSIKQWAFTTFNNENEIEFVAMATPDDLQANSEFLRLADKIVDVPGGSNLNNYANVDLIVKLAQQEKVDALWPGWGHASENPQLPKRLAELGVQFVGPTSSVMSALGDKIAANVLAQSSGVPSIPWSGNGVYTQLDKEGNIDPSIFDKATIHTYNDCLKHANQIGYPIMIKASEGGGGKGIRLVENESQMKTAYEQVVNEVRNSPIFMMKVCTNARHIEVQILGDMYGQAVALSGRDCTTQRRFQKIFEEGPPTSIVPPDTFKEMEKAAQRLTSSIGYQSAGTVEFLYTPEKNEYYFLELNPRLQVEHPVTEGITHINLPAVQLQVAMGIPLHTIPDIRRFWGYPAEGVDKIDFDQINHLPIQNHVIAARITAENPDEGFKPTSGNIDKLEYQFTPDTWGYFSVAADGNIHEYADSQFGHIFAEGKSRDEARKALILALKRMDVRGDIRTTVEYLVHLLETREFIDNKIDTSWLDKLIKQKSLEISYEKDNMVLTAALFRSLNYFKDIEKTILSNLKNGQATIKESTNMNYVQQEVIMDDQKYTFDVCKMGPSHYTLKINNQSINVQLKEQSDGSLIANFGGKSHKFTGREEPLGLRLTFDGKTVFIPSVYDPSELRSDVNGKLVRYLVNEGDVVEQNQPYAELEAMKMIMTMKSGGSGKISLSKSPGSIITAGEQIASLELANTHTTKQITNFQDTLSIQNSSELTHTPIEALSLILDGYQHPIVETFEDAKIVFNTQSIADTAHTLHTLFDQFLSVELPFFGCVSRDQVVLDLIKQHPNNLQKVMLIEMAQKQLPKRVDLIQLLLNLIKEKSDDNLTMLLSEQLNKLRTLKGREYGEIASLADDILHTTHTTPFKERYEFLTHTLQQNTHLYNLTNYEDVLLHILNSPLTKELQTKASEMYVKHLHQGAKVCNLKTTHTHTHTHTHFKTTWNYESEKFGIFTTFDKLEDLSNILTSLIQNGHPPKQDTSIYLLWTSPLNKEEQKQFYNNVQEIIQKKMSEFTHTFNISSITLISTDPSSGKPHYTSYTKSINYNESSLWKDIPPAHIQYLHLNNLLEHAIRLPCSVPNTYSFSIQPHASISPIIHIHSLDTHTQPSPNETMDNLLQALQQAQLHQPSATSSHLFFKSTSPIENTAVSFGPGSNAPEHNMQELRSKYAEKLLELKVDDIEWEYEKEGVKNTVKATSNGTLWLSTHTQTENYQETSLIPTKLNQILQTKRQIARSAHTTYAYDFLTLLESALTSIWSTHTDKPTPSSLIEATELIYDPLAHTLHESKQLQIGQNKVGMVGFKLKLHTPEHPEGRYIVLIANDITHKSGSFGVDEDDVYYHISEYARREGIPRIYISSNSGARIGLYDQLKDKIKIAWKDTNNPNLGYNYLYLTRDVYTHLPIGSVEGEFIVENNEERFRLDAIIGEENSQMGVENLKGSGKIAGQTSQAYKDVFTLSYVTGRSVGIGAYIVRLGQRVIQNISAPLILTGYQALNKLLGRDVYDSQHQLGGPQIMYPNGISHIIVNNDYKAMVEILDWLSYIPRSTSSLYDVNYTHTLKDPIDRTIDFMPPIGTPYDTRNLFTGSYEYTQHNDDTMARNKHTHTTHTPGKPMGDTHTTPGKPMGDTHTTPGKPMGDTHTTPGKPMGDTHTINDDEAIESVYKSGLFDRDSFKEVMAGWAKGVITGRARLGGIPVGVIGVDVRTLTKDIPADPADPNSTKMCIPQAGQVWFPDSAYKTAQAISDFQHGEKLPLFIFANWRGFAGGARDMFGEILKFGSMIVDNLRAYTQPVFVYIPPGGELRGGAWVVVDPSINMEYMEMYADLQSRGGILEPPGICEIKFKQKDQLKLMYTLDEPLIEMKSALETSIPYDKQYNLLSESIKKRENQLLPMYLQVANTYADLHDKSPRMLAKGVIKGVVDWPNARPFFYWRLRRRLTEEMIKDKLKTFTDMTTNQNISEYLNKLLPNSIDKFDDKQVALFFEDKEGQERLNNFVEEMKISSLKKTILNLLEELPMEQRTHIFNTLTDLTQVSN